MKKTNLTPFLFLISKQEFAVNFLRSLGYSREDAEDVFSELAVRWVRKPESIPPALTQSMLCFGLRQRAEDFRRRRDAVKRGNGIPNLGDDYLVDVPDVVAEPALDPAPGLVRLLEAELGDATGRREILLKVLIRGLTEGTSRKQWPDEFTSDEREAFMSGCDEWTNKDFRKAVSRTLSEIIKTLRSKSGLN